MPVFVVIHQKKLFALFAGAILLFAGFLCFYHLGAEPFQDYDEATYAEVTQESLVHGNYLSLTFLNSDYFRKPPLLFWLTTTSQRVFSDVEFALRLPGALTAFLLIPLVAVVCIYAGAGWGTGLLAAAILTTTSAAMEPARQVRFDVMVSFFIVAALYAGMRAQKNPRWYLGMGACVGLAVLTKSVIAVFAPVALFIYLLQRDRFAFLRDRWFWFGVGMFMLVAAPWHIYETIRFGGEFWHTYLGTQVIERAQTNLFVYEQAEGTTNADYLRYFAAFAAPWSLLFILSLAAFPFIRRGFTTHERHLFIASIGTVVAVFAVMFLSGTKAVTYLIPLYPFMAIALALAAKAVWTVGDKDVRIVLAATIGCTTILGAILTAQNVFHTPHYYEERYGLARNEFDISNLIRERAQNPFIYTYENTNLGSLQYYTELPFTSYKYVYVFENATTSTPGAFIVTTATAADLVARFPQVTFEQLYEGDWLSLFTLAS